MLKTTGHKRENWGERNKSFICSRGCALAEFPGEVQQVMVAEGDKQRSASLLKCQSLIRIDNVVRHGALVPEQTKQLFCRNLLCPSFYRCGLEEDTEAFSSCY